jgi:hypothetical protein
MFAFAENLFRGVLDFREDVVATRVIATFVIFMGVRMMFGGTMRACRMHGFLRGLFA